MNLLNNPITSFLVNLWAAVNTVRVLAIGTAFAIFAAYSTVSGYFHWQNVENRLHIESAPLHISFSVNKCSFLINAETLEVVKHTSDIKTAEECSPYTSTDNLRNAVAMHNEDIRGINVNPLWSYWVSYPIFFISIIGVMILNTSAYNMFIRPVRSFFIMITVWMVIAIALFPITFGNYSSTGHYYLNGKEYYSSSWKPVGNNLWVTYFGSNFGRYMRSKYENTYNLPEQF